jgi:hypothetical protein
MKTIAKSYRGFSLLVDLNVDRVLTVAAMAAALWLGGLIGTLL